MRTSLESWKDHTVAVLRDFAHASLPEIAALALLEGNGNVIALVELAAEDDLPLPELRRVTRAVCDAPAPRRVDGTLFFYPRHRRGLRMVFFDRDGTWEAMCGNGLRCAARYSLDAGLWTDAGEIVTDDGPKRLALRGGGRIAATLGAAREVRQLADDRWFAYTGVAHLVVFLPDRDALARVDVPLEGARLRYDAALCREVGHPGGVHVNFVAPAGDDLAIRTYEVGVEDETLCCGTGAVAAAHLAAVSGRGGLPRRLHTLGGVVEVGRDGDRLTLEGDVGYLLPRQRVPAPGLLLADGREPR